MFSLYGNIGQRFIDRRGVLRVSAQSNITRIYDIIV